MIATMYNQFNEGVSHSPNTPSNAPSVKKAIIKLIIVAPIAIGGSAFIASIIDKRLAHKHMVVAQLNLKLNEQNTSWEQEKEALQKDCDEKIQQEDFKKSQLLNTQREQYQQDLHKYSAKQREAQQLLNQTKQKHQNFIEDEAKQVKVANDKFADAYAQTELNQKDQIKAISALHNTQQYELAQKQEAEKDLALQEREAAKDELLYAQAKLSKQTGNKILPIQFIQEDMPSYAHLEPMIK